MEKRSEMNQGVRNSRDCFISYFLLLPLVSCQLMFILAIDSGKE